MKISLIRIVEWVSGNRVRLFFSSGKVMEVALPWVSDASSARIVDDGMGLDPGNGLDVSASRLVRMRGLVLVEGRCGWVGSEIRTRSKKSAQMRGKR